MIGSGRCFTFNKYIFVTCLCSPHLVCPLCIHVCVQPLLHSDYKAMSAQVVCLYYTPVRFHGGRGGMLLQNLSIELTCLMHPSARSVRNTKTADYSWLVVLLFSRGWGCLVVCSQRGSSFLWSVVGDLVTPFFTTSAAMTMTERFVPAITPQYLTQNNISIYLYVSPMDEATPQY